jgi:hypothetical protein
VRDPELQIVRASSLMSTGTVPKTGEQRQRSEVDRTVDGKQRIACEDQGENMAALRSEHPEECRRMQSMTGRFAIFNPMPIPGVAMILGENVGERRRLRSA